MVQERKISSGRRASPDTTLIDRLLTEAGDLAVKLRALLLGGRARHQLNEKAEAALAHESFRMSTRMAESVAWLLSAKAARLGLGQQTQLEHREICCAELPEEAGLSKDFLAISRETRAFYLRVLRLADAPANLAA